MPQYYSAPNPAAVLLRPLHNIVFYDGAWHTSAINANSYTGLTTSTIANQIFGTRADGGVDQIVFSGGYQTYSISSNSYSALTADAVLGNQVFASVPEPATLAILGLGGLLLRRKRA